MKSKTTFSVLPIHRSVLLFLLIISGLLASDPAFSQCINGQVLVSDGSESASLCLDEAESGGLSLYHTSYGTTSYAYVVTDQNNQILSISNSSTLQFENLIEGSYKVYGFSYQGNIVANIGESVFYTSFATGCWQKSYNHIDVKLGNPDASEIRTSDYKTEQHICLDSGESGLLRIQNIAANNTPYVFLTVDADNKILRVIQNSIADFTSFPVGENQIYGLAYTGGLLATYGMDIADNLSTGCYQLSENTIDVEISRVNGGEVYTQDFKSQYEIVTDDGQSNVFNLTNSGSYGAEYTYVLVDASNNMITTIEDSTLDLEGYEGGTYRIWGFSYSGEITLQAGQSIFSSSFSDGCFQRSFNAINIIATQEGIVLPPCTVASVTINALSETTICQNGPQQTVVTDAVMGQGIETTMILVAQEGSIINKIEQISELNISQTQPGEYTIYQIIYEDSVDGLLVGSNFNAISGCFSVSNGIEVTILATTDPNCMVEAECELETSILSADRDTICIEDVDNRIVSFLVDNVGAEQEGILITDAAGNILQLSANRIFEISFIGTQLFYHINYVDTVQIFGGESIDDLEGCYTLSNAVTIVGIEDCFIEPCTVSAAVISTASAASLCTLDSSDDEVEIISTGGSSTEQLFLLTRSGGVQILGANSTGVFLFSEDMPGDFDIYQLNYSEPFTFGSDLNTMEGCFAFSNPIFISNAEENCIEEPDPCLNNGGEIAYDGPVGICGDDGQNDIINIEMIQSGGSNKVFLVVNEKGVIVSIAPALVILSNPFPEGNYNIYALSYEDFPTGLTTNAILSDFTDLCLSNDVEIVVSSDFCQGADVRGGLVSDSFGEEEIKLCTNVSGEIFTIDLESTGSIAYEYQYVETDENNIITNLLVGTSVMYTADPIEMMNRRIWGVSYTGQFTALVGENITSTQLSDESYSTSDNFIAIEIAVVIGEDPLLVGTNTSYTEVMAGQETNLVLEPNMSAFLDYETAYILFDIDGVTIIDVLYPDDNFNITLPALDTTPVTGELLTLTAIGFTGEILLGPGDQANSSFLPNATDVTTGCFDVAIINIVIRVLDDSPGIDIPLIEDIVTYPSEEISVVPNPVRELLKVTFPSSFVDQKAVLNIYSIGGDLILSKNFNRVPIVELIDVTEFAVGVHTLQVYTEFGTRTIQFLKI